METYLLFAPSPEDVPVEQLHALVQRCASTGESHGKSPSWARYLLTSDRTRSYSLSWPTQTSNHQHLPALPCHDFQHFQFSLSSTSWGKQEWKPWITSWRLKIQSLYKRFLWKSWMHQWHCDAGLFACQIVPSHTFTILPPSFTWCHQQTSPISHTSLYIQ